MRRSGLEDIMNTLVIVLIAAVVLFAAYVLYGRWLANKWGIDPKAETPAVNSMMEKIMYLPMDGLCSATSFHPSPVRDRSRVRFRQQPLDGFRFCSGY